MAVARRSHRGMRADARASRRMRHQGSIAPSPTARGTPRGHNTGSAVVLRHGARCASAGDDDDAHRSAVEGQVTSAASYVGDEMRVEGVSLAAIAERFGTPG